jgi:UDP-GlcNAc:undecaprenyl-phosphate/decaprenyl-phosphate GlcNAc-1-phosphate transferase
MNLTYALIISIVAFLVTYLVTPWARKVSQKCGMVDAPNHRKMHTTPIPYGGGIAIFLGFLAAFIIIGSYTPKTTGFIMGAFLLVILGIFDDLKDLKALPKFIFQSIAAIVVINSGIVINMDLILRGHLPGLSFLAIPITFLWIIGITNAINLIDGLDGLAAGVSAISALTVAVVAFINGQAVIGAMALALAFAAIGFLPHNFLNQVFMGDTGSMFLGFSLATLSIMGSVKLAAAFSALVPVMILAIPIFDTLFAIVRRIVMRRPIYEGDKKHFHHRLLELGLSPKQTVIFIYVLSAIFGIMAIVSAEVRPLYGYIIFAGSLFVVFTGSLFLVYIHQLNTRSNGWHKTK